LMNAAAEMFIGSHDFRPFSGNTALSENTLRTVKSCSFTKQGNLATFLVVADGFLYNMVRVMVGVLLEVNGRRMEISDIRKIFDSGIRTDRCITAPPQGLYLDKVFYHIEEINE
ncbi:MAG: tRNA pseudouridine(38-40) synthase TruA, partial [Oscillospiraceae bacterium]|nr:tRNA pseudouridine(38-40) synthase TruA [Oscillospiraceae bacterium]